MNDDLISRAAAIDALEREKVYCTARDGYTQINVFDKYNAGLTDGIKALKKLPSAKPERYWIDSEGNISALPSAQPEIVRCKDCEFYTEEERWCRRLGLCGAFGPNDYCSRAERSE